jgi:hypothetical protein
MKTTITTLKMCVMALFVFAAMPSIAQVNQAVGKTAVASSISYGDVNAVKANNATDGNMSTRWSSMPCEIHHGAAPNQFVVGDSAWIYIDLGATLNVTGVELDWETARASDYKLFVSSDALSWSTIYTVNGATGTPSTSFKGSVDVVSGLTASGRYVKMCGTVSPSGWGYSLYEFKVFGTSTVADTQKPTTPGTFAAVNTGLESTTLTWAAATDNIGINSYDVTVNGATINTSALKLYVAGLTKGTAYTATIVAKDAGGNVSATPGSVNFTTLAALPGLIAYEGWTDFTSGSGLWDAKWVLGEYTNTNIQPLGLTFGNLTVSGKAKAAGYMSFTRAISIPVGSLDSLCISYLCQESVGNTAFNLTSASGKLYFNNTQVAGGVQANSYDMKTSDYKGWLKATEVSDGASVSFNLIVIKKISATGFNVKRWVYTGPAGLPSKMPAFDDFEAYFAGQYTTADGVDMSLLNITGIELKNHSNSLSTYDEIRFGLTFADVVPQKSTGIAQNKMAGVSIYSQSGQIVANLAGLKGTSTVTVIDAKGATLKSTTTTDAQVTVNVLNKGIYLLRVQNAGKSMTQKVILL